MLRLALSITLAALCACGGNSPTERPVGSGRVVAQVGPSGRLLRGDGSTALVGFELEIPAGALDRLVEVTVEAAPDVMFPDSTAVDRAFAVRMRPDPGALLVDATFRLRVTLPRTRVAADLFVARRIDAAAPTAIRGVNERLGIAAETVTYDPLAKVMSARLRDLGEIQVRAATNGRQSDDALRLAQVGYEILVDGTSDALRTADLRFAEAQLADPFAALPNLMRALSRVLLALDDRTDSGPALDSVGEALGALGLDLGARSLFERAVRGDWPSTLASPQGSASIEAVIDAIRAHLRGAIELALRDLDRVPASARFVIVLPAFVPSLPGDRELDAADVVLFRSLLACTAFWVEWLATLDFDVPPAALGDPSATVESVFAAFPGAGRPRRAPDAATIAALRAALVDLVGGIDQIAAETDDQSDDLVVFPRRFDATERAMWRANLFELVDSIEGNGSARVRSAGGTGELRVDLDAPLRSGSIDPRRALPAFRSYLPLAGTIIDPTLGGALPDLDADRATTLFGLFAERAVTTAEIVADGSFTDWPATADLLDPRDPAGDASGNQRLGVDITRIWMARGATTLGFRVTVADGEVGYRTGRGAAFVFRLRDVGRVHLEAALRVVVALGASGPVTRVFVDGVELPIGAIVVAAGGDLELTLDRDDLSGYFDVEQTRVFDVRSESLQLSSGRAVRDRVRGVLVGF